MVVYAEILERQVVERQCVGGIIRAQRAFHDFHRSGGHSNSLKVVSEVIVDVCQLIKRIGVVKVVCAQCFLLDIHSRLCIAERLFVFPHVHKNRSQEVVAVGHLHTVLAILLLYLLCRQYSFSESCIIVSQILLHGCHVLFDLYHVWMFFPIQLLQGFLCFFQIVAGFSVVAYARMVDSDIVERGDIIVMMHA